MNSVVPPEKVRAWEQLAAALLILGAVSAAGSIAFALLPPSTWAVVRLVVGRGSDTATLFFVVTGIVWRSQTRQIRRAHRDEEGGRRFAIAWALAAGVFVAGYCAVGKVLSGPDPAHAGLVVGTVLRVAWIAIAVAVIVAIRRDVRGLLARPPGVVPAVDPTIRYDVVPTADATAADDDFWDLAARSAREAGADLALLETTHALDRRWLLVPASGELTELRAQLIPGAVLTLFPTPPGPADLTRPARANEYYGLIQPTAGAPIYFQLVLPSRVADFLTRARGAHRSGLYLATDPAARTAITPSAEQPA